MGMIVDAAKSLATDGVTGAIGAAARVTGVDFGYLVAQARIESGMRPDARARTSSATGLYQFIDRTWLAVIKRHGPAHGLGWAADAIGWTAGKIGVADAAMRRSILALRNDPAIASLMAAEHAADNKTRLEARLGRAVGQVDLYLAHFLGLGGATRFLKSLARDGAAAAASVMPRAARANRAIFHTRDGGERSLEQVYQRFAAKLGGPTPTAAPAPVMLADRGDAAATTVGPRMARAAYLMLAEFGA